MYDKDISVDKPLLSVVRMQSRSLREYASTIIPSTENKEAVAKYKALLFEAAKKLDEAALLLPDGLPPSQVTVKQHSWWCWLTAGMMAIFWLFLAWVAWVRFVEGKQIGLISP